MQQKEVAVASKAVVRGANTHMRFRDFHTMSQLPAFLPGAFIAAQTNDGSTNAGPTVRVRFQIIGNARI